MVRTWSPGSTSSPWTRRLGTRSASSCSCVERARSITARSARIAAPISRARRRRSLFGGRMTVDQVIAELDTLQARGADLDELLEAAVRGVHKLDSRFHWTGIYELFDD